LTLIVVVMAKDQGASPTIIGAIFAGAGVGGILGALLAPFVQRRFSFGKAIIVLIWGTVALWFLFALAVSPVFVMMVLFVQAVMGPSYDTVQLTYRLNVIPDALQGRVNSVFRMIGVGMAPFGIALTGILLERAGGAATAVTMGCILFVIAILTSINHHVRNAPSLMAQAAD
ncbi:MAG: MFS transporter, partial [Thermomicrobiales bacterium]